MLGLGSYTFRWSVGHNGVVPDKPMTHADMLDVAATHGLGLVQFADNIPLHPLSNTDLDALAAKARKHGVVLEIGTQSFDLAQMRRYIEIAQRLDAGILRVALDAADAEIPINDLAAGFQRLVPLAQAAGTRIAVENHFNYPAKRLAALMLEINDPCVGVCLDVANSICAGEWPMETVATLAPFAINLHLKDYDILPDPFGVGFAISGTPLGQGRTNCEAVLAALPKDRDINIILEHWLPQSDDMAQVRASEHQWLAQSVAFAREALGL